MPSLQLPPLAPTPTSPFALKSPAAPSSIFCFDTNVPDGFDVNRIATIDSCLTHRAPFISSYIPSRSIPTLAITRLLLRRRAAILSKFYNLAAASISAPILYFGHA